MKNDLKQTIQNGVVTLILAVIALAAVIGSGVLVFAPPTFIAELGDDEVRAMRAEIESRDVLDFEPFTFENGDELIRYAYVGEPLPEKLVDGEDVSKRTTSSYTRVLGRGAQGEETFELIAFPQPQFIEREDGWYTIEYAVAPAKVFKQVYLKQNPLALILGRTARATTIYSGSGDGWVQMFLGTSWATVRDSTNGTTADYTAISFLISSSVYTTKGTLWTITRAYLPFDTSSIPASATIDAASLAVHATTTPNNAENDGSDYVTVVRTSQATHTALVTADFDNIITTEGIASGDRKDITSISVGYLTFPLNATGIGWIAKNGVSSNCSGTAGITCLGLREGHDNANSEPTTSNANGNKVTFDSSEATGTTYDPYLSVTYSTFAPWQFDPF